MVAFPAYTGYNACMPQLTSDYVTNQNPGIYKHAYELGIVPDYVQEGVMPSAEDTEKLASVSFADQENRLLPIHTKFACWMSATCAAAHGVTDERIWGNIEKMASVYDIVGDVEKVRSEFDKIIKQASTEEPQTEKYAMVIDYGGFQGRGTEGYYRIDTEANVLMAAESLHDDFRAGRVPESWYYPAAASIYKAASSYGIDLRNTHANIWDAGQPRVVDIDLENDPSVMLRKNAGYNTDEFEAVLRAASVKLAAETDFDARQEIAATALSDLCYADMHAGLFDYTSSIPSPYHTVYSDITVAQVEKAASSMLHLSGVLVPASELCRLAPGSLEENFRAEHATVIKKAMEFAKTETAENMKAATELLATLGDGVVEVLLDNIVNA